MKKRLVSVFLVCLCVFALFPTVSATATVPCMTIDSKLLMIGDSNTVALRSYNTDLYPATIYARINGRIEECVENWSRYPADRYTKCIYQLLKELSAEMNMSILLITHNFGIVAEVCDRVSVMYAGKVVEDADVTSIFRKPEHPYTRALIHSIPKAGMKEEHLPTIPGAPPDLYEPITSCAYLERCPFAGPECSAKQEAQLSSEGHLVACARFGGNGPDRKGAEL